MSFKIIVTGTDTGIGKTVFSAALAGALGGYYWKPVQAGLEDETDSDAVRRLSGLPAGRVLPEAYRLNLPASPHVSAARDGVVIRAKRLSPPACEGPLVIEGAGGLFVPLSLDLLQIDVFASWGLPVILCARTELGAINHTLLSLEAMRRCNMLVLGVAFIGPAAEETESAIVKFSGARRLGRLPFIDPLNAKTLAHAFRENFALSGFSPELV
jgi:dethiobiotin synthetase